MKFGRHEVRTRTIVGVTLIALLVAAWLLGPQVSSFYMIRKMAREHPELRIMPKPLPDTSIYAGEGGSYSAWGYQFDLPWEDVERTTEKLSFHSIQFRRGIAVTLIDPGSSFAMPGAVVRDSPAKLKQGIVRSFDVGEKNPNYEFLSNALYANPEVWFTFSRRKAYRNVMSLTFKSLSMPAPGRCAGGVFVINTEKYRGFQFGDPAVSEVVRIKLFDQDDRQIEILFGSKRGMTVEVSQPEINRMIQSLRPVEVTLPGSPNPGRPSAIH